MKRVVWTFGLIAGAIMGGLMAITMGFPDLVDFDKGEIVGYTIMILAFLMVYFGIRSYRDNVLAGVIGFGRAFKVGILITLVASCCYVASWEVISHTIAPDFTEKYVAHAIAKAEASGATPAKIDSTRKAMANFSLAYKNPIYNVGMTFLEVFPIGVIVVLVSAGVLSRKKSEPDPHLARS